MSSAADEYSGSDSLRLPPAGVGRFNNRELSTIAALASLHFAVSFASRLFDSLLGVVTGPFFVYVSGVGDEAVPNLLLAAAVTLVPRVGTVGLSLGVVWLLNGLLSGTFSLINIETIAVSVLLHESILWICGVTRGRSNVGSAPSLATVLRTAAALGLANGAALYLYYVIYRVQLGLQFDSWYVGSVAMIVGVFYGGVGAAIGTVWAFQLRRTAP